MEKLKFQSGPVVIEGYSISNPIVGLFYQLSNEERNEVEYRLIQDLRHSKQVPVKVYITTLAQLVSREQEPSSTKTILVTVSLFPLEMREIE